jgi:hypothetical protein
VDANFDHRYLITLPYPEIKRLAISPNSQTLACVLRDKEEEENPGSLFLAPIAQLMSSAERLYVIKSQDQNRSLTKFHPGRTHQGRGPLLVRDPRQEMNSQQGQDFPQVTHSHRGTEVHLMVLCIISLAHLQVTIG